VRVRETVEVARPPNDVRELLVDPQRRPDGQAWSDIVRDGDGYRGTLHASAGAIALDFDCRFQVTEEQQGERVRLRGTGLSPRLAFTVDGHVGVRESGGGGSTVDIDVEVLPAGTLAGLGQRRLAEQARRLITAFVEE
jgi:carbon monoxide dehydrogenase subunit G